MLKVIRLDGGGEPGAAAESLAPNPLSGNPVTRVERRFVHPQGLLSCGMWECAPGSFEIPAHPTYEMCTIMEGEAVIEQEDGSRLSLAAGDSIFIPRGAHTIWHVSRPIRKTFLCCAPEEAQAARA